MPAGRAGAPPPPARRKSRKLASPKQRGERRRPRDARPPTSGAALPLDFAPGQRILVVGDGDLSFSAALASLLHAADAAATAAAKRGDDEAEQPPAAAPSVLVATSYDTLPMLHEKYASAAASVAALEALGCCVGCGVDATDLARSLKALRRRVTAAATAADADASQPLVVPLCFDRVVFAFPHLGTDLADQARAVAAHQELLALFFRSSVSVLAPRGRVVVALKTGLPYGLWNAPRCASSGTGGSLALRTSHAFDAAAFPGYRHRRTRGDAASEPTEAALAGGARAYVWQRTEEAEAALAAAAVSTGGVTV